MAVVLGIVACVLAFGLGVWVGRKLFEPRPEPPPKEPPRRTVHALTPGAAACAEEARAFLAEAPTREELVELGASLSVEAYGRGLVDLRAAIVEVDVLPADVADEICNIAMARMEGR